MKQLYLNRYRIKSSRCSKWDYSSKGFYFVTINTLHKASFFGFLQKGYLCISEIGRIVLECLDYGIQKNDKIEIIDFVILDNHLHILLQIKQSSYTFHKTLSNEFAKISPTKGSLSVFIRSFKSAVSKRAKNIDSSFAWSSRYHDKILRNDLEIQRTLRYIDFNTRKHSRYDI